MFQVKIHKRRHSEIHRTVHDYAFAFPHLHERDETLRLLGRGSVKFDGHMNITHAQPRGDAAFVGQCIIRSRPCQINDRLISSLRY